MGLDGKLKRFFPAVLLCFVALAAYFQAVGLGELVASSLTETSPPPPPALPAKMAPLGGAGAAGARADGAPILARNPFDSITGPLDGKEIEMPSAPAEDRAQGDPYSDPVCDGAKVLLITAADDPAWSFAAIAEASGKATLRRPGDDIGGRTVYAMVWDRVWLMKSGARCQIPLHEAPKMVADKGGGGEGKPFRETTTTPAGRGAVPREIAEKIQKISENQYVVDRSAVSSILEQQALLFGRVRIAPAREGDRAVGLDLKGIRPDSLLSMLGVQNGDRLESINGFEMADPTTALQAYARLQSADKVSVKLMRGGKPVTVDIDLK